MNKIFSDTAWEDYLFWLTDKKKLKRINELIRDIDRNMYEGIGKPEPLKYEFAGWWSRRIDDENRLIYRIVDDTIQIAQCRTNYKNRP